MYTFRAICRNAFLLKNVILMTSEYNCFSMQTIEFNYINEAKKSMKDFLWVIVSVFEW